MVFAIVVLGCGESSQKPGWSGPRKHLDESALIAESERRHDFGLLVSRPGRTKSHVYRLVNDTEYSVRFVSIINRKACCGRVRADRSGLGPGESSDIEVTLLLDGKFGDVVHEIEVVVDRPGRESLTLRTTAVAVPALRVEPVSLPTGPILVGAEGATPEAVFRIIAAGDAESPAIDLDAVGLRSTIGVGWEGVTRDLPPEDGVAMRSRLFHAALDAGGEAGERRAEVQFEDATGVLFRHVVDWSIVDPISIAPKMIVTKSESQEFRLILRSQDRATFRVLSVDCPALGVYDRRPDDGPAAAHDLAVKIAPTAEARRGLMSILTDHHAMPRLEIPFVVLD